MSDEFVSMLREKTEEGDLNTILKPCIGGYTKRSVLEYLSIVKKQQQNLRDAYAEELQRLQTEKETIRVQTAAMRERSEQAEGAYRTQTEELQRLQAEYAALEKDMDEAVERIKEDETRLQGHQSELDAERQKTEQARQNVVTCQILLDTANAKVEELEHRLAEQAEEILRIQQAEQLFRESVAQEKAAEMDDRIRELTNNVELLQNEVTIRDRELESRAKRLETLTRQEQSNHRALEELQAEVQERREQNECAESENEELGRQLQEQMEQSLALSRENSRLKAANAILQRKLESEQTKRKLSELMGVELQ